MATNYWAEVPIEGGETSIQWGAARPGEQPALEYSGGSIYDFRGQGVPADLKAVYPDAPVLNLQTDPRFAYGRQDDFMGKLGSYAIPILMALGTGMVGSAGLAGGGAAGLSEGAAASFEIPGAASMGGTSFNPMLGLSGAEASFEIPGAANMGGVSFNPQAMSGLNTLGSPVESRAPTTVNSPWQMLTNGSSPQAILSQLGIGLPGSLGVNAGGMPGSMPWGSVGNLATMGSGIYNLLESQKLKQLAMQMSQQADPFGPYRPGYAAQLQQLMQNPSMVQQLPGYQAGLDAVTRKMASQGYLGSGNMMAALARYGENAYNQQVNTLSNLAGAQFNPANASQIALTGNIAGMQGVSNSLNRLGMGMYLAGGARG